jgi:hypothetical protein
VGQRSETFLVTTVYTCDDGDTFNALKHVDFNFTTGANTGPIQLLGGTGAFTNLGGHGVDNGNASSVGQITGFVTQP